MENPNAPGSMAPARLKPAYASWRRCDAMPFRHRRTRVARKVVFFAERPVRGDVFLCVWELKKQGRNAQMKLTTVILAPSMLALAPAASFAQSSPSPNNQSGPNV